MKNKQSAPKTTRKSSAAPTSTKSNKVVSSKTATKPVAKAAISTVQNTINTPTTQTNAGMYNPATVYQIFRSYMKQGTNFETIGKTKWAMIRSVVAWHYKNTKVQLNASAFGRALNAAKSSGKSIVTDSIVKGKDRINIYRTSR